jgi:hypothetical protein
VPHGPLKDKKIELKYSNFLFIIIFLLKNMISPCTFNTLDIGPYTLILVPILDQLKPLGPIQIQPKFRICTCKTPSLREGGALGNWDQFKWTVTSLPTFPRISNRRLHFLRIRNRRAHVCHTTALQTPTSI